MLAPNHGHVLVFHQLDIAGPHEPVDHKTDHPRQVRTDLCVAIKNGGAAAAFVGKLVRHLPAHSPPCVTHEIAVLGDGKTTPWLVHDLDAGKPGNVFDQANAMCVCQHFSNCDQVLLHGRGAEITAAQLLHKVRQCLEAHLIDGHLAEEGQDAVVDAVAKDGQTGCTEFATCDPRLLIGHHGWHNIGE